MRQRILVVEDNEDCRELLSLQLSRLGYKIIEAENGLEGVKKAVSEVPDLIIMDLGLPGINGIEATRQLKADARTKHIPILIHTAWLEEDIDRKALEAGAAKVLIKPVPHKTLENVIQKFVRINPQVWPKVKEDVA